MEDDIINIFYNELLPEVASNDSVTIGDLKFNVNFSTSENKNKSINNNDVVINIRDKTLFNEVLINYVKAMIEHIITNGKLKNIDYLFFDGNMHDMLKSCLLNVWYNATEEDFKDPIFYLRLRTNFINDNISLSSIGKTYKSREIQSLNNLEIENKIDIVNPSANETPYAFKSQIVDNDGNYYNLPNIYYGISDNKCYIYAIKNDKNIQTDFSKKVNRLLYKANKDLVYDYEEESIKDVSVSQLYSTVLFFKFLQDNNISDIIIKNYFPIRYEAKEIAIFKKIKKLEEKLLHIDIHSEEYITKKQEIENLKIENSRIQNNIINKYLRIFRRLSYHFPNVLIKSYPYELDNSMHIKMEEYNKYSHILNEVYESANFNYKKVK